MIRVANDLIHRLKAHERSEQADELDEIPNGSSGLNRRRFVTVGAAGLLLPASVRSVQAQEEPPIEPLDPDETVFEPDESDDDDEPSIEPEEPDFDEDASAEEIEQQAPGGSRYFVETGHNLAEPFLETWTSAGGVEVLGLPLSEERFVEGDGVVEQAFETVSLRYEPATEDESTVRAARLGEETITGIASESARRRVLGCNGRERGCQFFEDTGHTVSGDFADFWEEHGGRRIFGLPVSEPFDEGSITTQVFERAVLDRNAEGTIQVRKLMLQQVEESGLAGDPAFVPAPPTLGVTSLVSASDGLRLRTGPSTDTETLVVLPDNAEFIAVPGEHGDWVPGYVDGYAGYVAAEYLVPPEALPAVTLEDWDISVWQGAALGETNVRAQATTSSRMVRELQYGEQVRVVDWVKGEEVFENAGTWAQLEDGSFVYERNIGRSAPVQPPPVPGDAPSRGKWIDVHLVQQLMVAYEGRIPVRTAVTTTGMPGWETPAGFFAINTRVPNETMESGSIGAENFYVLEDVLFTQYFTNRGHALHFAWWKSPETIGRPGSHGCLNLVLDDARFFWEWAEIGTPVYCHR